MLADHAGTIARSFAGGSPPIGDLMMVARGEQGRVWRLDTAEGPLAIKELLIRQTPADAAADVAYQEAVLKVGTVPMPRPVRAATGDVLLEIDDAQIRAYEWVDLLPMDTGLDAAVVGETVAAIHRTPFAGARPLHPWYTDRVGEPRWTELLHASRAAAAPFAEALAAEIPDLLRLEAVMAAPADLHACHRDLWADNILPTAGSGVCVIDWENCGLEDPAQEIPMILVDFGAGDQRRVAELYQAYLEAGGPARVRGRGSFTMVIAQFGHFWELAIVRYLSPTSTPDEKGRCLSRLAALIDTPFRIGDVDDLLDSIAAVR
jgi:Ser/Thr protein kinase RdoA (MazF antagonist)